MFARYVDVKCWRFFFFKYVDGEMRENIVDGENKYKGETKIRKRGEFIEIRMIF